MISSFLKSPKNYHEWTKSVDKGYPRFFECKIRRIVERDGVRAPVGSEVFVLHKLFVRPIVRSKAFSRRITESCSNGTIIVIIMNLCNFRFGINTHQEHSGQVRLIRSLSQQVKEK